MFRTCGRCNIWETAGSAGNGAFSGSSTRKRFCYLCVKQVVASDHATPVMPPRRGQEKTVVVVVPENASGAACVRRMWVQ